MTLLEQFKAFFNNHQCDNPSFRFLLAVSGGVDSVVLCELSFQAGLSFSIVHCNFQLRGLESERDEQFVTSLAQRYKVTLFKKKFDTAAMASERKWSIQEAARELRYQWFEDLRKIEGYQFVLLAHHADDNIETVLMNFFRGTGLDGLTGMNTEREQTKCLRPLLQIRREEIERFAKQNQLSWVEDSSNASNKYTRNYIRNELLPAINEAYPGVSENVLQNIRRFQKVQALYKPLVDDLLKKLIKRKGRELQIPVAHLLTYQNTSLIYELIRPFGFGEKQVEEVLKLCFAESGKYIANDHYQIIRHRNWLIIAPVIAAESEMIIIEKDVMHLAFSQGTLTISRLSPSKSEPSASPETAYLDTKRIIYPLLLRKWKTGDYFYPLGMPKKKKLARFFIDQKMSKTEKQDVWVLESAQRIIWVIGMRIDDRFKISETTRELLRIDLAKFRL